MPKSIERLTKAEKASTLSEKKKRQQTKVRDKE